MQGFTVKSADTLHSHCCSTSSSRALMVIPSDPLLYSHGSSTDNNPTTINIIVDSQCITTRGFINYRWT